MRNYKNIKAFQYADKLTVAVYDLTKTFPKNEQYGLVSQLRRSAVSISANIAEGASRQHNKDYLQFLFIARASLAELEYLLCLSIRLGLIFDESVKVIISLKDQTARTLFGLISVVQLAVH